MPDTTKNLFDSHHNVVDSWSKDVLLQVDKLGIHHSIQALGPSPSPIDLMKLDFAGKALALQFNDVQLQVSCTAAVAAVSFVNMQDTSIIKDAYLIALDLMLKPMKLTRRYRVTMRALSDGWVATHQPEDSINASTGELRVDSSWQSTSPDTVDNTTSLSTSTSYSIGGSIGFFGRTPTADISGSYSLSYGNQASVTPVKVANHSGIHALDVRFVLQSDEGAMGTFQPHISGVLTTNDDREGIRSDEPSVKDARHLGLELCIWALPDDFLEFATIDQLGWTFMSQVPHITRRFKVRVPPLPPSVVL